MRRAGGLALVCLGLAAPIATGAIACGKSYAEQPEDGEADAGPAPPTGSGSTPVDDGSPGPAPSAVDDGGDGSPCANGACDPVLVGVVGGTPTNLRYAEGTLYAMTSSNPITIVQLVLTDGGVATSAVVANLPDAGTADTYDVHPTAGVFISGSRGLYRVVTTGAGSFTPIASKSTRGARVVGDDLFFALYGGYDDVPNNGAYVTTPLPTAEGSGGPRADYPTDGMRLGGQYVLLVRPDAGSPVLYDPEKDENLTASGDLASPLRMVGDNKQMYLSARDGLHRFDFDAGLVTVLDTSDAGRTTGVAIDPAYVWFGQSGVVERCPRATDACAPERELTFDAGIRDMLVETGDLYVLLTDGRVFRWHIL